MVQMRTRKSLILIVILSISILFLVSNNQTVAQLHGEEPEDGEHLHEPSSNPGLKIRMSQPGLNYTGAVAVDMLAILVGVIHIPDQSGHAKIPLGHVDYKISNMKVTDFVKPLTAVVVQPRNGLTWTMSNAGISIRGDCYIKIKNRVETLGKSHWFEGHISRALLNVSLTLGATSSGHPTIRLTGCSCIIPTLRIKLHGGASWFYNRFMKRVERTLRSELQNRMCDGTRKIIDEKAAAELAKLDTQVQIGKLVFDYRLVSNPSFSDGYFETSHRGEFFFAGDTSEAPFQPRRLPSPPSEPRMMTFWISDYVLNTAAYSLHQHGVLQRLVTKKNLPPATATLLDLTCCPKCTCIGKVLPAAAAQYPNATVEIDLRSSERPSAVIETPGITAFFFGTSVLNARLINGSAVYLLTLKVGIRSSVTPAFNGTTLLFSIRSMSANISVNDSAIGPVSASLLNLVVNFVLQHNIIPELNEVGARGFTLPNIGFVRLINISLQLQANVIFVSADVKYNDMNDEEDSSVNKSVSPLLFETLGNIDTDQWGGKLI